eukprot:1209515-Rhodomonas_salina.2
MQAEPEAPQAESQGGLPENGGSAKSALRRGSFETNSSVIAPIQVTYLNDKAPPKEMHDSGSDSSERARQAQASSLRVKPIGQRQLFDVPPITDTENRTALRSSWRILDPVAPDEMARDRFNSSETNTSENSRTNTSEISDTSNDRAPMIRNKRGDGGDGNSRQPASDITIEVAVPAAESEKTATGTAQVAGRAPANWSTSKGFTKKKSKDYIMGLGTARVLASIHVVVGHLHAMGAVDNVYLFGWGFTWVPWFFMLSGTPGTNWSAEPCP